MNLRNLAAVLALGTMLVPAAYAGPAIACKWEAIPGSLFEQLDPLRRAAMKADDSPADTKAALAKLAELRAAIKPDDPLSLMKAGFWTVTMHAIGVTPETDGGKLIMKALELRPNDPEYHFFAALASMDKGDRVVFRKHWTRARELAQPGSAVAVNLKVVAEIYPDIGR